LGRQKEDAFIKQEEALAKRLSGRNKLVQDTEPILKDDMPKNYIQPVPRMIAGNPELYQIFHELFDEKPFQTGPGENYVKKLKQTPSIPKNIQLDENGNVVTNFSIWPSGKSNIKLPTSNYDMTNHQWEQIKENYSEKENNLHLLFNQKRERPERKETKTEKKKLSLIEKGFIRKKSRDDFQVLSEFLLDDEKMNKEYESSWFSHYAYIIKKRILNKFKPWIQKMVSDPAERIDFINGCLGGIILAMFREAVSHPFRNYITTDSFGANFGKCSKAWTGNHFSNNTGCAYHTLMGCFTKT